MKKNYCVVGLTGQSGAGKTTVSEQFKSSGFYVINCDLVSREVTKKGSECNKKLSLIFPQCFDGELSLDRLKMSQTVFGNKENLRLLNDTIFPFIIEKIFCEIDLAVRNGEKFILLDAPTLFEANLENKCDFVVSVVADIEIRAERIASRDNISKEQVLKRFQSQHSQEFFVENSDFVIENNKDIETAVMSTASVIEKIKEMANVL